MHSDVQRYPQALIILQVGRIVVVCFFFFLKLLVL